MTLRSLFRLLRSIALLWLFAGIHSARAQGDGPHTFLLSPKGLWGVNPKWMSMQQNFLPSGTILIKDADLQVDVFPTTVFHTFGIKGRFVQALAMINPGSASGRLTTEAPGIMVPEVSASGYSDGFVAVKVGLIGAPALSIPEFTKRAPAFSMLGYLRVWYSGSYSSSKPLNLGTNRTTIELGAPMSIPLFKKVKGTTWLESYPAVQLYTANNDPTLVTSASTSQQLPLFFIENHLTHSFTTKLWAGFDLRYQNGGALKLDDVAQDNRINILGGGVSAGYAFLPFLSATGTYGTILYGDNEARSDMLRLSVVFVYAKTKKEASAN